MDIARAPLHTNRRCEIGVVWNNWTLDIKMTFREIFYSGGLPSGRFFDLVPMRFSLRLSGTYITTRVLSEQNAHYHYLLNKNIRAYMLRSHNPSYKILFLIYALSPDVVFIHAIFNSSYFSFYRDDIFDYD